MRPNRFSTAAGVSTIVLGISVLVGWLCGSERFTSIGPGHTTVKANTALTICALGAALLLQRIGARRAASYAGLLVLLIGGVTVVEYVAGVGHGIDELLFTDPNRADAGRMGLNTAVSLFLLGSALLLLRSEGRRRALAAQSCVIGALTIAFLAVMGYVNGVRVLYGPASFTAMALSTALALSLVALALLASSSAYGLPAVALAQSPGGRMARRLLPLAAVPIVLHAIRSRAVDAGLVSANVGVWLVATLVVVAIVAAVLLGARAVDQADRPRALLAAVVASSSEAIVTTNVDRVVTSWNSGAERLFGWPASDAIGRPIAFLSPPGQLDVLDPLAPARLASGQIFGEQTVRLHRDGSRVPVALTIWTLFDENGSTYGYGSLARDIREQLALQKQQDSLIEAQKLKSLGVLAGGIAHNFNNLLLAILGNANLTLSKLPSDSPLRAGIEQIELAAVRAAELARDMLAYSGKGATAIESINLPALIEETGRLVTAGHNAIEIHYRIDQELSPIVGDATQIRQVVLSVITNAAEALGPTGGSIDVRADVVSEVPGDGFRLPDARLVGPFVRIEVEDWGIGMDADTLGHLFDPFFTTKLTGRGLGLAAVLGIIGGHGGAIRVTSELGTGTVFTLLLPCTATAGRSETPLRAQPFALVPAV